MKHPSAVLLLGAGVAALVAALAVFFAAERIARDLETRARLALQGEALEWVRLRAEGRTLILAGTAPDEPAKNLARAGAARVFGVRDVDESAVALLPVQSPYRLMVSFDKEGIVLRGALPSVLVRRRLMDAFGKTFPDRRVDETGLVLARGAPSSLEAVLTQLLPSIQLFSRGALEIEDKTITLKGEARDPAAYAKARAQAKTWRDTPALLHGYAFAPAIGLPRVSPYVFGAVKSGDAIALSGFFPSTEVEGALLRLGQRLAGLGRLDTALQPASGAPPGFDKAAAFTLGVLRHLKTGDATLSDRTILITGSAKTSGDYLELEAMLAFEAPEGFAIRADVSPPEISPYLWSITREDDSLILAGYAPSEAIRREIRKAVEAAAEDFLVIDRTDLASGVPAGVDLVGTAVFAAAAAIKLDAGSLSLKDESLSLTGETRDYLAGRALRAHFGERLPPGIRQGTITLAMPEPEMP